MAAIMFQGTGSDVGKSVLVAGICRALYNRGYKVAPFKPQNMSNNAAVTSDGGEIGRAQALQAMACKIPPSVDMNPVLLKPQSNYTTQLVLRGKAIGKADADYFKHNKPLLLGEILKSFIKLEANNDFVIVEGAGSPAETNLRVGDIANMGFALKTGVPVVLIGDIDRGGVIASIVGTKSVLSPEDCAMIKGFVINKFRGHLELFQNGYKEIECRTGLKGLGIMPYSKAVSKLPPEDAVVLQDVKLADNASLEVAIPILPRIANFDDFDPLKHDKNIRLTFIKPNSPIPQSADIIIIPGSKATIADLRFLREQGWDIDIYAHVRAGKKVVGICGGYQMLGRHISDPDGIEGDETGIDGLGLLDCETVLEGDKTTRLVAGKSLESGIGFEGYEIHLGKTTSNEKAWLEVGINPNNNEPAIMASQGAISKNGLVYGCYIHGLFDNAMFRAKFLQHDNDGINHTEMVNQALDELAAEIEEHLDIEAIIEIAKSKQN